MGQRSSLLLPPRKQTATTPISEYETDIKPPEGLWMTDSVTQQQSSMRAGPASNRRTVQIEIGADPVPLSKNPLAFVALPIWIHERSFPMHLPILDLPRVVHLSDRGYVPKSRSKIALSNADVVGRSPLRRQTESFVAHFLGASWWASGSCGRWRRRWHPGCVESVGDICFRKPQRGSARQSCARQGVAEKWNAWCTKFGEGTTIMGLRERRREAPGGTHWCNRWVSWPVGSGRIFYE